MEEPNTKTPISWEKEDNPKTKINYRKLLLITWGAVTFLMFVFLIYQFGWLKLRDGIYQEGLAVGREQGKAEINNVIIQNLQQFGMLKVNMPVDINQNGQIENDEIRTIILIPQVQQ